MAIQEGKAKMEGMDSDLMEISGSRGETAADRRPATAEMVERVGMRSEARVEPAARVATATLPRHPSLARQGTVVMVERVERVETLLPGRVAMAGMAAMGAQQEAAAQAAELVLIRLARVGQAVRVALRVGLITYRV
jgi:hypothetical protein